MKNKIIIYMILFLLLFSFTTTASAEDLTQEFDLSIGTLNGYTEYEIGAIDSDISSGYTFRSLLEFPLDVEMINISYRNDLKIQSLNIGGIEFDIAKNINDDAETFKDSDWFAATGIHVKDIIGKSSTEVEDITKWDLKLKAPWNSAGYNWKYSIHVGFKQDKYDFVSYDLKQTTLTNISDYYPDAFPPEGTVQKPAGDNITYEATYDIPYVGVEFQNNLNDWNLKFDINYSNWVDMEDEDHHLHRNLIAKGKGNGSSLMIGGKANYKLGPEADIFLNIDYNKTEVDGSQDQYHVGYVAKGIDYRAEQEYTQYMAGVTWKF
ncbi:MAG: omptin family outer membrane protease [Bacillota bacterium]